MTFNQFKNEADRLINFYGRTPPAQLLETGSIFSDSLTLVNLKQALYRDFEKAIEPFIAIMGDDVMCLKELYNYVDKIEKKLEKRYYEE